MSRRKFSNIIPGAIPLCAVLGLVSCAQPRESATGGPALRGELLEGNVKSVEITRADYREKYGEWYLSDPYYVRKLDYDQHGNVLAITDDEDSQTFSYDESNRLIEHAIRGMTTRRSYSGTGQVVKEAVLEGEGELNHSVEYLYQSDGKLSEQTTRLGDGSLYGRTRYVYDPEGRRTDENHYDGTESLDWRIRYYYDKIGLLIEKQLIDSNGFTSSKVTYTHDVKERFLTETEHLFDGSLNKDHYLGKGDVLLAESWQYDTEGLPTSKKECIHDNRGRLLEEAEYDGDGRLSFRYVYKYDAQGRILETTEYDSGNEVTEKLIYEYTLDSFGNVSTETVHREREKFGKTVREPKEVVSYVFEYW